MKVETFGNAGIRKFPFACPALGQVAGNKGLMKGFDRVHGGMQVPHELFNREKSLPVPIPQFLGDCFLKIEDEPVASPSRELVEFIADPEYELAMGFQLLVLPVGKQPRILKVPRDAQSKKDPGQPEHMVVVTKAADTLLEVGLQKMAGIPEGGAARKAPRASAILSLWFS